jgi:hypothetical protein
MTEGKEYATLEGVIQEISKSVWSEMASRTEEKN